MSATEIMVKEHDHILEALDLVDTLADRAPAGNAAPELVHKAIDFIKSYADALHHRKEEDRLFTAMGEAGMGPGTGPVKVMLIEHDEGRICVKRMVEALGQGLGSGEPGREPFAAAARDYTRLLRDHIMKENEVLYPMADQLLAPEAAQALLTSCRKYDEEQQAEHTRCLGLLADLRSALS